jgi:hypothetical protein
MKLGERRGGYAQPVSLYLSYNWTPFLTIYYHREQASV